MGSNPHRNARNMFFCVYYVCFWGYHSPSTAHNDVWGTPARVPSRGMDQGPFPTSPAPYKLKLFRGLLMILELYLIAYYSSLDHYSSWIYFISPSQTESVSSKLFVVYVWSLVVEFNCFLLPVKIIIHYSLLASTHWTGSKAPTWAWSKPPNWTGCKPHKRTESSPPHWNRPWG